MAKVFGFSFGSFSTEIAYSEFTGYINEPLFFTSQVWDGFTKIWKIWNPPLFMNNNLFWDYKNFRQDE